MVSHEARIQGILRERDRAKRRMQVWIGLFVVWTVVLGWVVWGFINALDGDAVSVGAWLAYLVPVAVLGIGSLVAWSRVRATNAALLAQEESDLR